MNWFAFIVDILQVIAPIFEAHTTGKTQEIAQTVDQVTGVLKAVSSAPASTPQK